MAVDQGKIERAIEKMADLVSASHDDNKCLKYSQSGLNLTHQLVQLSALKSDTKTKTT